MLLAVLACASSPPVEAPAPAAPPEPPPSDGFAAPERIVAVGDLHGDLEASKAVFQLAGLIDETGHWSGGKAWLVQTGDTVDRGPDSKGVLALLRTLEQEAAAAGGRVLPLLGNHEVMNMTGDWRYVNPEDLQGYGGEAARKAAFTESGEDGRWLRTHDTTVRVGSTVFVHGGIDERWSRLGTRGINAGVRAALGGGDPTILGSDGPLWNRAYLLSDPVTACAELGRALTNLGATRMVVGHTTQKSGTVGTLCGGQLYAIDTGISAHYGRHLAALEIRGEKVTPLEPSP